MEYTERYKEIYVFEETIDANSEREAINKVNEDRELRLTFDANMDEDIDLPDPIEILIHKDRPEAFPTGKFTLADF